MATEDEGEGFHFDMVEGRDYEVWTPPEGPAWEPSPEDQARMAAFIREWYRTHRPVVILCRLKSSDADRLILEPFDPFQL